MGTDDPSAPGSARPPRRWPVVAVVLAGLLAGGAVAVGAAVLAADDVPADREVRAALGERYGLDDATASCTIAALGGGGVLDDDLRGQLVEEAVRGPDPAAFDAATTGVHDAIVGCLTSEVTVALQAAGADDPVAGCAAATIAQGGPVGAAAAVTAPLAEGSGSRQVVSACALEHLATSLEDDAGIAPTDARCVAAEVLDQLPLESVLAGLGALAVTQEVADRAAAAVATCAAD